jgi:hypothetical protein
MEQRVSPSKKRFQYRGYNLTVARNGHGWRIWAYPLTPDLPILLRHSFTVPASSDDEAMKHAKEHVDRVLARPG